ncbi:uncharacterized protein LOC115739520 [Rhodamnia argentea]|uniref:Uncharacterized protein LOC115739520 n=1 Tax=Rhodamnia argentea TaxID=178133 RepID=A0A8B8P3S1_9MYRT|nr:uncharacterized protein LOC115739520 [Rhodamnia argentea]
MASPAFVALPSTSPFRIKLLNGRRCQPGNGITLHSCQRTFPKLSMQVMMAQFGESERLNVQLDAVTERLQEVIPDSVKHFPWKKAETVLLNRVALLGRKALKWSLITLFVASSLSDVLFAISRNRELTIPIGLFVGCLLTDFLKEVMTEFSGDSQLDKGFVQCLTAISCVFVLLKFASAFCGLGVRVFLSHVANGGVMQTLWLWRNLSHGSSNEEKQPQEEGAIA